MVQSNLNLVRENVIFNLSAYQCDVNYCHIVISLVPTRRHFMPDKSWLQPASENTRLLRYLGFPIPYTVRRHVYVAPSSTQTTWHLGFPRSSLCKLPRHFHYSNNRWVCTRVYAYIRPILFQCTALPLPSQSVNHAAISGKWRGGRHRYFVTQCAAPFPGNVQSWSAARRRKEERKKSLTNSP